MEFKTLRKSFMLDLMMPIALILLFIPQCMNWYAPNLMYFIFFLQKGIFLICALYFIRFYLFRNKLFWLLTIFLFWLILVTWINGDSLGDLGSILNVLSGCIIAMYCISRNPKKYISYVAVIVVLLLFLNTILWKEGGMYLNSNGQESYVLGTKTSITYYQITAGCFVGLYEEFVSDKKKYKVAILHILFLLSVIIWNIRQPISTSILCLAVYYLLLLLKNLKFLIIDKIYKFGFIATIALNIGIVFFNAQLLFSNFITNVLHENADLSNRTTIWKIVLSSISSNPVIGHGLNTGIHFSFDTGTSSINQNTHNFLLYLVFISGIIGAVYFLLVCFYTIRKTYILDISISRILTMTLICFGMMWITEQINTFDKLFLCLIVCYCAAEFRSTDRSKVYLKE